MARGNKHLTQNISQLREAIKRKYRQFKQGTLDTDLQLEKQYKPIISELRKPKSEIHIKEETHKEGEVEPKKELDQSFSPNIASSTKFLSEEEVFGEDEEERTASEVVAQDPEQASQWVKSTFTHPLTQKYMLKMIKDQAGKYQKIDHTYGPRFEGDKLLVGAKQLTFDADGSLRLNDTSYKGTPGLYELVFMRLPDDTSYDDKDLIAYKDILVKTNAHKRNYKYSGKINRNNSHKYKAVIADLFPRTYYGTGMKSTSERDITYWDDPNELVERLRLLVISAETGNTGHSNEIINIIEELREAKYIKGGGNGRFKALIK